MKPLNNPDGGRVRFPCTSAKSLRKSTTGLRDYHGHTTDISPIDRSPSICPCGNQFTPKSNNQKYCSQKCPEAQRALRAQKDAYRKREFNTGKREESFDCICPRCRKKFVIRGFFSTEPRPGRWAYCEPCKALLNAEGWPDDTTFPNNYGARKTRGGAACVVRI